MLHSYRGMHVSLLIAHRRIIVSSALHRSIAVSWICDNELPQLRYDIPRCIAGGRGSLRATPDSLLPPVPSNDRVNDLLANCMEGAAVSILSENEVSPKLANEHIESL